MSENENEFSVTPAVPDAVVAPVEAPAPVVDPIPVVESMPAAVDPAPEVAVVADAAPAVVSAADLLDQIIDGVDALSHNPLGLVAWVKSMAAQVKAAL